MSVETHDSLATGSAASGARAARLRLARAFSARFEAEADRLFLWVPAVFATGIGLYFRAPVEPPLGPLLALAAGLALALLLPLGRALQLTLATAALITLGLAAATLRTLLVAAPVLAEATPIIAITGEVVLVEPAEDAVRLTLAPETIGVLEPDGIPARVTVRLRSAAPDIRPGDRVALRGGLMPPPGPAIPGGFDYARQAWFQRIGAVGWGVGEPVLLAPPAERSWRQQAAAALERLRLAITYRILEALPQREGAIAAALITGLRSSIDPADDEALRDSGLYHVLSISGLHMMLVVGTIFWTVRSLLALSPVLALTRPIKKWAAASALLGGTFYLLLSGAEVATQRAYVMAAIMLVAVLFDRPAITLRNVAIAALAVLVVTPEALVTASFQMSFAATIALVAAWEALRDHAARRRDREGDAGVMPNRSLFALQSLPSFLALYVGGLVLTSLVAGLASGPFALYHFNRASMYGLAANVAAMPFVGVIVMPAALLAVIAMPFGLEHWPLAAMAFGIEIMLAIGHYVAAWPGAVHWLPTPPLASLILIVFGGLWLVIWRTRWRLCGLAAIAAASLLAAIAPVPVGFVDRDGRLAAIRTAEGLALVGRSRSTYVAERWMRAIGDGRALEEARQSPSVRCDGAACFGAGLATISMVEAASAFRDDCLKAELVIARVAPPQACREATHIITLSDLDRLGALSLWREKDGRLRIDAATALSGTRPWTPSPAGAGSER